MKILMEEKEIKKEIEELKKLIDEFLIFFLL